MTIANRARNVDSYIGFDNEGTWGTPVAAAYYVPLLSQSLNYSRPIIKSAAALGIRYTQQYIQGVVDPNTGGFSSELWQDEFAPVMAYTLGADSIAGSSSPWVHTISRGANVPSITLRKGVDLQEHIYPGYKINTLTVNIGGTGEMPTFDVDGISKAETTGSVGTPSFTTQNAYAGHMSQVYLAAGSTARTSIVTEYYPLSGSITFNNNIEAPGVPLGQTEIQEEPVAGELIVTGSLVFDTFDDSSNNSKALYDDFKAGTTKALRIVFAGTDPYRFEIYLPKILFNGESPNASGKTGPIGITLNFEAFYDSTNSTDVDCVFHDAVNTAYI